ncbi:MAG TPA: hypothetical protein VGL04_10010 [Sporichthyaceae bacterium]|jgi:hypothetical protein
MTRTRRTAGRSALVALVVGVLALIAGVGTSAAPASAHSAGKAVVLVRDFTLSPVAGGKWQATVAVADFDSGAWLQGTSVTIGMGNPATTVAPAKFVQLQPTSVIGQYQGVVGKAAAGPARFDLRVRTVPGSPPVQPYDHSFPVTLVAGAPLQVISGAGSGSGGSSMPLILGVAAVVLVGAMLYGLFSVRRRTAVPAATNKSGSPVRSAPAK